MMLPPQAQKALAHLIESGVASSAEKLSKMSRTKWAMQTVSVNAEPGDRLQLSLGGSQPHYGAYFTMPGGLFLVLISEPSGKVIVNAFLGQRAAKMQSIPDLELAVLAEISNVMVNSVAAAFADACDMGFLLSAPQTSHGVRRELFDQMMRTFPAAMVNLAVTSYVHMSSPSLSTDCAMIILFNGELTRAVVDVLGRREES